MVNKIGIDAGGSLIKLAYKENGQFHYKSYSLTEMDQLVRWLNMLSPTAKIYLTGGKSALLKQKLAHEVEMVEEFKAITEGAKYLLVEEGYKDHEFILVSIGTGTSIYFVTENSFERVTGTGVGGGTLMGLGYLLTGSKDFNKIVDGAKNGNRKQSDLLVRDIYSEQATPLVGDLTAANFGKAHINEQVETKDHLAALIQMIGESVILLSSFAANVKQTNKIVFVGSTITGNEPLKNVLTSFKDMMKYEPVFLEKGAYAGALGAIIL